MTNNNVPTIVSDMLAKIEAGGEAACIDYARTLDKFEGEVVLSHDAIEAAIATVPEGLKRDIDFAAAQIRTFAVAQRGTMLDLEVELHPGVTAGHKNLPVQVAGAYVPGGRFAHIASALMGVVTAKAAGVPFVVACSPSRGATVAAEVIYALKVAGADCILALGGVQAIAAMAYGLFTGKPANIVVGPGNRFIVEAKRKLFGRMGIDLIAGPTEVAVLADDGADAEVVAVDLVSQAEHGPDSPCVLITTSRRLGEAVKRRVPELIATLPGDSAVATVSWRDYGEIVVVDSREEAAQLSDLIGSEHLEVQCDDLAWWHERLQNYGSLFLGEQATVAMGDKCSGPNHVLPTRFASGYTGGLNVSKFLKTVSYQRLTTEATYKIAQVTARLSRAEGMEAHARAADIRLKKYFPSTEFNLKPDMHASVVPSVVKGKDMTEPPKAKL